MPPRHILLLSADPALARLLPPQLGGESGFLVAVAAFLPASEPEPRSEAVLLDAALAPGPAALCAALAAAAPARPVLVLGHGTCEGPDAPPPPGAADRLPKPVRPTELILRLRAALAAFDASPGAAVPVGPFRFHAASRRLLGTREAVRLTETEAAILHYLLRAGGRSVPREELLGEVWGFSAAVATHTLETHVYRLRRKLGEAGALLRREAGGYRLAAAG